MTRRAKKLILGTMGGILLIVIIAVVLGGRDPAPTAMAILQSRGRTTTNSVLTEVFLLTNPGPATVEYVAIQEWRPTTAFLTNGVLASHSTVLFHIPLSDKPTRLLVSCSVQRRLRDFADLFRDLLGLQVQSRSSEYTVFSDELHK
jgi:hypothetical protein